MRTTLSLLFWALCPFALNAAEEFQVTVLGAVTKVGQLMIRADESMAALLNKAQCTGASGLNWVRISRQTKEGRILLQLRRFDPAKETNAHDFRLKDGDAVLVPNTWVDEHDKDHPITVIDHFCLRTREASILWFDPQKESVSKLSAMIAEATEEGLTALRVPGAGSEPGSMSNCC